MAKNRKNSLKHEFDDVFLAEEISWRMNGRFLNIDFKTRQPSEDGLVIRHNPLVINVFQAKDFINKLYGYLKSFEEKYGEIEKPEFMKNLEKEMKKKKKEKEWSTKETSKYIG